MELIEPICLFWGFLDCILRYRLAVIVYFYLFALYLITLALASGLPKSAAGWI